MTNFEKIKEMSIEELENLLCSKMDCQMCIIKFGSSFNVDEFYQCHDINDSVIGMWLEMESEEE